jgi:predicted transcriptional regulator
MKKPTIFEQVRAQLALYEGQHNRIAKETGVPQSSISRLHQGDCTPRLSTVQPLLDWFDAQAKPKKRQAQAAGKKLRAGRITTAKPTRIARRAGVGAAASL